MAVIYIHGVSVRSNQQGLELQKPFNRWLGPKIAVNGRPFLYLPVYWGDIAAAFRWNLKSRPPTQVLKMGGTAGFDGLGSLRSASRETPFDRAVAPAPMQGPVLGAPQNAASSSKRRRWPRSKSSSGRIFSPIFILPRNPNRRALTVIRW